jgi:ribosomal protein S18 acetylase RimI-like enzyme
MITDQTEELVIRLATPDDIEQIEYLDSFSSSPTRHIHRDMHKYFGSIDPSTHERTLIFLLAVQGRIVGKAELMIPTCDDINSTGYIKRVIIHPDFRGRHLARILLDHILTYAQTKLHLQTIDLHVWEENTAAIKLYKHLGFQLQHRELYFRKKL